MELTQKNEIMRFEVIGDRESNGNYFYAINYEEREYWVKKHLSQIKFDRHPKTIYCNFIGNDSLGRPRFVQNRTFVLNDIYEEGVEYTFKVECKERDNNSNADYYIVVDEYNEKYRLYNFDPCFEPIISSEIQCRVEKIDTQKGRLNLIQASLTSQNTFKEKKWYDPYTVFNEIGETGSFAVLFNNYAASIENNLTKQQQELIKNVSIQHNNWVFSYLNFIDQVLIPKFVDGRDYDSLEIFTDISLKFQYWLLEGSSFLSSYHSSIKEDTILRSKGQIAKYEAQKNAISILREGSQTDFIDGLLKKLRASGRLVYKKQEYIETLIKLLFIDSNTIQSKISELAELFELLIINETIEEYHKSIIIRYLDRKINNENNQLNKLLHFSLDRVDQDEYQNRIETILQIIATQILLEDKNSIAVRRRKSQFYRFISYLSNGEEVLLLVNLSLDSLTGVINDDNIFEWKNIIEFNLDSIRCELQHICKIAPAKNTNKYYFKSKRGLITVDNNINIVSLPGANKVNRDFNLITQVHSLMNNRLHVCSVDSEYTWAYTKEYLSIHQKWDSYLKSSKNYGCPTFKVDDEIFVEVKPNQKNSKLIFVKILNDSHPSKDAVIFAGNICNQWIDDVSLLVNGGEILKAKIKTIDENEKIGLSIREYTANYDNQPLDAKGIFQAYANYCSLEYNKSISNSFEAEDSQDFVDKGFCDEIVYVIDSVLKLEKDPLVKFELLHFAQLTSLLIGDSKSLYYKYYIQYLMNIDSFSKNESGDIEEERVPKRRDFALSQFTELQEKQLIIDLLKEYSNHNITPMLFELATKSEKDDLATKVAKAILADKILKDVDHNGSTKQSVKRLINTLISGNTNESLTPLLTEIKNIDPNNIENLEDLGRESLHKEFKTSFVYSSSSNDYNIDEQSSIIMRTIAGFLNANGGVLYIGVDDNGFVRGIQNDIDATGNNLDKYQRRIQQSIVDNFNKDINSTINITFKRYNSKTICLISIPRYHQPVAFKNEFWQRQGNETRIIKGGDLVPFIIRQTNAVPSNLSSCVSNELLVNINKDYKERQSTEDGIKIDHYADLKGLDNDVILSEEVSTDILSHWNIYNDGTYVVGEDAGSDTNLLIAIPLEAKDRFGYALQCYDNGCVNKVEMRTIFDKQKNRAYQNGIYECDGVNLRNVFTISKDCTIIIVSTKSNKRYIKGYKTSRIATHTGLHLKGNQIVSPNIDSAKYYILDEEFTSNVEGIMYDSPTPLGKDISKEKIRQIVDFLCDIGVNIDTY